MRAKFSLVLTPAFLFVVIALIWNFILNPLLEGFISKFLIKQLNQTQVVTAEIEQTFIHLFPPRLVLSQINLTPNSQTGEVLSPTQIGQVALEINAFKLLIGRVEVNRLAIEKIQIKIQIDPLLEKKGPAQEIPVQILFSTLEKFPIRKIDLSEIELEILSHRLNLQTNFNSGQITLMNLRNNLSFEIGAPEIVINQSNYTQNFQITALGQVTPREILIDDLTFNNGELANLAVTGMIKDWKNLMLSPEMDFQSQGYLDLPWLDKQLVTMFGYKSLQLLGSLDVQQRVIFKNRQLSSSGKLAYQNFSILENEIGDGSGLITYVDSKVRLKNFAINHPAGSAVVGDFELDTNKELTFSGQSRIQSLDLQKLFFSIGLTSIPTWLNISGNLKCQGQFTSPYAIGCDVDAKAQDLKVSSGMGAKATVIAEIPEFAATGTVTINNKAVGYNANITVQENKGQSKGVIDYQKGFDISFETPEISFRNIRSLVGLDFEGSLALKGMTRGDSRSAIFAMTTTAKDFVLEKYQLGQVEASLNYKSGILEINDLLGAYQKSQYLGNLALDLNQYKIQGRISAPVLASEDLFTILGHLFTLPFPLTGDGKAEMKFSGPFDFWNLDFDLKGLFNEVRFGKDRFDLLSVEAKAAQGRITLTDVFLQRNQSKVTATGTIGPDQKLALQVQTENLRLEDSLLVSSLNSNFYGTLVAKSNIVGTLTEPQVLLKAQIKNSVFAEQELPDSELELELTKKKLDLQFNFLGSRLKGEILYPFVKSEGPFQVSAKAEDWQLSTFLSFLTGADSADDFSALVSGDVNLISKTGDIFVADGALNITKADIRKSGQQIKNKKPMTIQFKDGFATLVDFSLSGDGNQISLTGERFTSEDLNIRLSSELDLKFLHIFLPFLEDINGPSQVNASIRGKLLSPEIFGSAFLNNVFIRLKGFPHAIEKIRSDIAFSQNRIIVNSIKAQMAGGTLNGDGTINFLGLKNLPMNLRLRMENVSLNVPDQVKTQGSGELLLSGTWFPYTLGGAYRIQNATIEKEFTENINAGQVKQSIYLPKTLREEVFEPIQLDLQIITERPLYIKNTLIDGYGRGNLQVKGTPSNPVLLGKASIEKDTKLNIKDKIFEIQTGTVNFTDPNEVNPDLFITAQSRISDYEVNVLVQGSSKNPSIRLTSIPPLSDQDIISLLALGVTSSQLDQNIQSKDQQAQTGYEIGAAILSNNPLSRNLQDRLGVNLQFTSAYDSTRNIAVPKVTVSRKLTDRLNASASRTLGDQTTVDVKMQFILNKNLSAIGTWEDREVNQSSDTLTDASQRQDQSVFGLDLEFKVEFK